MDSVIPLQVIGVVRTDHIDFAGTPIQAGLNRAARYRYPGDPRN